MDQTISLFIEELKSRIAPSVSSQGFLNASPGGVAHAADGVFVPVFTTVACGEEGNFC